jgi:hypothetical protein
MRLAMLGVEYESAVFIGGMEGILDEYQMFNQIHPAAKVVPVSSPGGAARMLARQLHEENDRIDFARMFSEKLAIDPSEARDQIT